MMPHMSRVTAAAALCALLLALGRGAAIPYGDAHRLLIRLSGSDSEAAEPQAPAHVDIDRMRS